MGRRQWLSVEKEQRCHSNETTSYDANDACRLNEPSDALQFKLLHRHGRRPLQVLRYRALYVIGDGNARRVGEHVPKGSGGHRGDANGRSDCRLNVVTCHNHDAVVHAVVQYSYT